MVAGPVDYGAVVRRELTVPVAGGEALAQALRDATAGRVRLLRP
jgi:hypothetical protein